MPAHHSPGPPSHIAPSSSARDEPHPRDPRPSHSTIVPPPTTITTPSSPRPTHHAHHASTTSHPTPPSSAGRSAAARDAAASASTAAAQARSGIAAIASAAATYNPYAFALTPGTSTTVSGGGSPGGSSRHLSRSASPPRLNGRQKEQHAEERRDRRGSRGSRESRDGRERDELDPSNDRPRSRDVRDERDGRERDAREPPRPEGGRQRSSPEGPRGEKPKKRKKYAPKACDGCRARKTRCSGSRPCARCARLGLRCSLLDEPGQAYHPDPYVRLDAHPPFGLHSDNAIYITQPTGPPGGPGGASIVNAPLPSQSLAPPRPPQRPAAGPVRSRRVSVSNSNAGRSPGSTTPPAELLTRLHGMESHIARMQAAMEAAGIAMPPFAPDVEMNGGAAHAPPPAPVTALSVPPAEPPQRADGTITFRCGSTPVRLPSRAQHEAYLEFYFRELNPHHPIVNVNAVREYSHRIYSQILPPPGASGPAAVANVIGGPTGVVLPAAEAPGLALLLTIYAAGDALRKSVNLESEPSEMGSVKYDPGENPGPPYVWYRMAQELVGRAQVPTAGNDLTGAQILFLQAFYLAYTADMLAAYAAIGRAARQCLLQGLHLPSATATPYENHMRQRVMYCVYYFDRRMSLFNARPYSLRWADVDIGVPAAVNDVDVYPNKPLPPPTKTSTIMPFLEGYLASAHFMGDAWDVLTRVTLPRSERLAAVEALDARISACLEGMDRTWAATKGSGLMADQQFMITRAIMLSTQLLLYRPQILSLNYDEACGTHCGELACALVDVVASFSTSPQWLTAAFIKCHALTFLFSTITVLATLLITDVAAPSVAADAYRARFHRAVHILYRMADEGHFGAYLEAQLAEVIRLTSESLEVHASEGVHGVEPDFDYSKLLADELRHMAANGSFPELSAAGDWGAPGTQEDAAIGRARRGSMVGR